MAQALRQQAFGNFALELTAKRASFPHSEHSFRVEDYHLVECPALVDHYKARVRVVGMLTKLHEERYFDNNAWKMSDAPRDYIETMLDGIVAFEFNIESIVAKSKLSQNRDKEDFESVKNKMKELNKDHLHDAMSTIKNMD